MGNPEQPDDQPDDDPVARMNAEDERQQLELANIDRDLDEQQQRLEQLRDNDPISFGAFGDRDEWLNKQLNNPNA